MLVRSELKHTPPEQVIQCSLSPLFIYSNDQVKFQEDLLNISRTTLSSKLLTHHKDHFAKLAVQAVLRLKGSGNLEAIHLIKKLGGSLIDSYLDEGLNLNTFLRKKFLICIQFGFGSAGCRSLFVV